MKTSQLKHKEVEHALRKLVRTLPIETKIPTEKQLAADYGYNFQTVRKALKALVEDGIIVRRIGSGSFVARNDVRPQGVSNANGAERRIGLLIYQRSNDYAQKLLQSLTQSAAQNNFALSSSWIADFGQEALRQAKTLEQQGCRSLLLPWFPHHLHAEVSEFVKKCRLPVSLPMVLPGLEDRYFGQVNRYSESILTSTEGLCDYFRLIGKSKPALLGPSTTEDPILARILSAYSVYTSKHDLPNLTFLANTGSASMDRIAKRLGEHRGELGIVCYDDEHALRMITAMHKIGLRAPEDYAIVGHNDTDSSRYSDPPLSTMIQDFSRVAVGLLKKSWALHQGTPYNAEDSRRPRLLIRETCGGKGKIDSTLRKKIRHLVFDEEASTVEPPNGDTA